MVVMELFGVFANETNDNSNTNISRNNNGIVRYVFIRVNRIEPTMDLSPTYYLLPTTRVLILRVYPATRPMHFLLVQLRTVRYIKCTVSTSIPTALVFAVRDTELRNATLNTRVALVAFQIVIRGRVTRIQTYTILSSAAFRSTGRSLFCFVLFYLEGGKGCASNEYVTLRHVTSIQFNSIQFMDAKDALRMGRLFASSLPCPAPGTSHCVAHPGPSVRCGSNRRRGVSSGFAVNRIEQPTSNEDKVFQVFRTVRTH